MKPALEALGFTCRILTQAKAKGPFLFAERIEDPCAADRARLRPWRRHPRPRRKLAAGLAPWELIETDGRYYGRGVADNKGQHTINLAALAAVLAERGKLGFNAKWLIEMGEETGSPGLRELCAENREAFARRRADRLRRAAARRRAADHLSRLPRRLPDRPLDRRARGRPSFRQLGRAAVQSRRSSSCTRSRPSSGRPGRSASPNWCPTDIPESVRRALADCEVAPGRASRRSIPTGASRG